ncbi:unnamed protein product [Paramecium sonneborni]|uniref:BRCT domain-containing protein n=1 Tax=Paramecium sonneborni TaxID=65129 RepID=A0A8S1RJE7_9CILI|nr:unnamed protein product [Paramecium sonneborni]
MQSTNNSQRSNYLQNSSSSARRARIFDTSQSSEHRNTPSIIPISNSQVARSPQIQTEEFNVQGLQQSQVSEVQINDLNKVNQFQKLPDLSRCKVKFIKRENQSTQTEADDKDLIIREQEALIKQLQRQIQQQNNPNMEFSFHKENMDQQLMSPKYNNCVGNNQTNSNLGNNSLMTNSPYKKQSRQQQNQFYFTAIPQSNNKSYIIKPQNTEKLVLEYTKQKSNKDYFFSALMNSLKYTIDYTSTQERETFNHNINCIQFQTNQVIWIVQNPQKYETIIIKFEFPCKIKEFIINSKSCSQVKISLYNITNQGVRIQQKLLESANFMIQNQQKKIYNNDFEDNTYQYAEIIFFSLNNELSIKSLQVLGQSIQNIKTQQQLTTQEISHNKQVINKPQNQQNKSSDQTSNLKIDSSSDLKINPKNSISQMYSQILQNPIQFNQTQEQGKIERNDQLSEEQLFQKAIEESLKTHQRESQNQELQQLEIEKQLNDCLMKEQNMNQNYINDQEYEEMIQYNSSMINEDFVQYHQALENSYFRKSRLFDNMNQKFKPLQYQQVFIVKDTLTDYEYKRFEQKVINLGGIVVKSINKKITIIISDKPIQFDNKKQNIYILSTKFLESCSMDKWPNFQMYEVK